MHAPARQLVDTFKLLWDLTGIKVFLFYLKKDLLVISGFNARVSISLHDSELTKQCLFLRLTFVT